MGIFKRIENHRANQANNYNNHKIQKNRGESLQHNIQTHISAMLHKVELNGIINMEKPSKQQSRPRLMKIKQVKSVYKIVLSDYLSCNMRHMDIWWFFLEFLAK